MVPAKVIPLLPVVEGAFPNPKGRNSCLPPKVSGVFNDLYPEGYWIMSVIHGRGGQCFHPDSIRTSGKFALGVDCVMDICWHMFCQSFRNVSRPNQMAGR